MKKRSLTLVSYSTLALLRNLALSFCVVVKAFSLSTSPYNSVALSATALAASTSATCAAFAHAAFFLASSKFASATSASLSFSKTFTSTFTFISCFLVSASILAAFCRVSPSLSFSPISHFFLASVHPPLLGLQLPSVSSDPSKRNTHGQAHPQVV